MSGVYEGGLEVGNPERRCGLVHVTGDNLFVMTRSTVSVTGVPSVALTSPRPGDAMRAGIGDLA
jgi:hypothetical protein